MTNENRIEMETNEGMAEAVRDPETYVWTINTPWGGTSFYGTRGDAKCELYRWVQMIDGGLPEESAD